MDKRSIMIFGVGELQQSIIKRAKAMGLFVVGIDPCSDAYCKDDVDAFEVVGGQDYEGTLEIAKKYRISAIVTAATDKPLVMMARVANALSLPFYSEDTARWSTDKYQMKQRFLLGGVPCAKGRLIKSAEEAEDLHFPVICKPRDNSGSRGVKLCRDLGELQECIDEAKQFSRLDTVLVEEFIEGKEYSIEALHYNGKVDVIQYTEKITTRFPYNVELGHIQPAKITDDIKNKITDIVCKIDKVMHYENCASHTELKINERGIYIIETSPRLGGDYITSILTPLSTGVNMEEVVLKIAIGDKIDVTPGFVQFAGVKFFAFEDGLYIKHVPDVEYIKSWPNVVDFSFSLVEEDIVEPITSSLNRYGHLIIKADSRDVIENCFPLYEKRIMDIVL